MRFEHTDRSDIETEERDDPASMTCADDRHGPPAGDAYLHELAARQHGVVATHQLLDAGWTYSHVARLVRCRGWDKVASVVLRRSGSADSAAQRISAAVLQSGPRAWLSHESAVAWWGHRGCRLERPIHVVTELNTTRTNRLAKAHRVRFVDENWVTDVDGIAVVRPELAALEFFAIHRYGRAERVVESMWSQRLLSGASLRRLLADMGARGRNGTAGLRRYVAERSVGYEPPDSGLEARCQQILEAAGIRLRRQVDLGGERHWTGRVDFVLERTPLVIEVQSELHHSSQLDRVHDRERIAKLRSDGFDVVEVTDEMVWTDPERLVSTVRSAVRRSRDTRS